jgi:single-stranded DNA-binding protein
VIVASIHGRAGQDGELKQSAAGKAWSRLNIAVAAGQDRESSEPYTQWITVVGFAKQAEELSRVAKGQTLSAIGRLEQTHWQAPGGEARSGWQLIADAVVMVKSARPQGGRRPQQGDPRRQQGAPFNDEIPFG